MATTTQKATESSPTAKTIHFFEVREKDNRFYRVFARLITFKRYSITIERNGQRYVIESKYPLDQMLIGGNTLLAFVYKKKKEEFAQFYRLPQGRNTFNPDIDLEFNYDYSAIRTPGEHFDANETIQAKRRKIENLKSQITHELAFLEEYSRESLEFAQSLSSSFLAKKSSREFYEDLGEPELRTNIDRKSKQVNKTSKKDLKKMKKKAKKASKGGEDFFY